jgi:uncharacterized protein YbjT (DUF2867 family)
MKYLITGATGDIGSKVVELLIHRGERPRVFVRDGDKARKWFGDRSRCELAISTMPRL